MVGTITLTGFFLRCPTDKFTVIVCSRSLDSLSCLPKNVPVWPSVIFCAAAIAVTDSNNTDKITFFIVFLLIGSTLREAVPNRFTEIHLHDVQQCRELFGSDTEMQADRHVSDSHRFYATHTGKNRHRSEFTLPIGQQVALEKVGERCSLRNRSMVGANTAYPAFGASIGTPDISASTSHPRS